ncbi:hypothetical protein [Arsenophonus nasoniae]|uniref:hypothetical protein n=2 Tax=Arsenophonus nasoniae TaxID=638 RepID=UPI0038795881
MMTKNELVEKVKPFAVEMVNTLASKQHVFNKYLSTIIDCKNEGVPNKLIVEAINLHLNQNTKITLQYFKNLLFRSGYKKHPKSPLIKDEISNKNPKRFGNFQIPEEKTFKHNPQSDNELFTKE